MKINSDQPTTCKKELRQLASEGRKQPYRRGRQGNYHQ